MTPTAAVGPSQEDLSNPRHQIRSILLIRCHIWSRKSQQHPKGRPSVFASLQLSSKHPGPRYAISGSIIVGAMSGNPMWARVWSWQSCDGKRQCQRYYSTSMLKSQQKKGRSFVGAVYESGNIPGATHLEKCAAPRLRPDLTFLQQPQLSPGGRRPRPAMPNGRTARPGC
jgi:hypothetical protein